MMEAEDDAESVWTNSNLLELLTSLSETMPAGSDTTNYLSGMKSVDWNKVAFHPFSPEECKQKWTNIMEKIRKLRSLPDLIAEAKIAISDPLNYRAIHPEVPKRPMGPRKMYFKEQHQKLREKHPNMKPQNIFKLLYKKFDMIPEEQRVVYEKKHASEVLEYQKKMQKFSKQNEMPVNKMKLAPPYKRYEKELQDLPVKPPHNSYSLFCMDYCKASEGESKVNAPALSRGWKDLSATEKVAYKKRWIELRRQYALDMDKYLDGLSKEEQNRLLTERGIGVSKVPKLTAEMKKTRKPKMPSHLRECRSETQERWKDVPIKEKERYKNKVHEATKRYKEDLQKWFMTLVPEKQLKFLKDNPFESEFLDVSKMTNRHQIKPHLGQTSDSEDENISDEEDDMPSSCEEQEDEEEEDIIMFEIN